MNNVRLIRCGSTSLVIGQLFEPSDLIDPAALTDPVRRAAHLFDRFGMLRATNDDVPRACCDQQAPTDRHGWPRPLNPVGEGPNRL